jgi:hypothetical protein
VKCRLVLNALTALSSLLFIAATTFCVYTCFVSHTVYRHTLGSPEEYEDGKQYSKLTEAFWQFSRGGIKYNRGVLLVSERAMARTRSAALAVPYHRSSRSSAYPSPINQSKTFLGFWFSKTSPTPDCVDWVELIVPVWALAGLSSVAPIVWAVRRHREMKRARIGCCPTCGYDLRVQLALSERSESNERASPQRCPECGTPATSNDQAPMTNK